MLTQIVGCSYAEAAQICGVPVGTIRSASHGPATVARTGARCPERMTPTRTTQLAVGTSCSSDVGLAGPAGAHGANGPPASNFTNQVRGSHLHSGRRVTSDPDHETHRTQHRGHAGHRARLPRRAVPTVRAATGCARTDRLPRSRSTARGPPEHDPHTHPRAAMGPDSRAQDALARPPRPLDGRRHPAVVRDNPDRAHVSRWRIPIRSTTDPPRSTEPSPGIRRPRRGPGAVSQHPWRRSGPRHRGLRRSMLT